VGPRAGVDTEGRGKINEVGLKFNSKTQKIRIFRKVHKTFFLKL
jgi:hypothetical protein